MPEQDPKPPSRAIPRTPPERPAVGSDPGVPIYEHTTPEELTQKLAELNSIEEVLRIQDQLAKFVRERYEKPVAVLFSDIAGSTAYFEKYGDAEGRRMIQRHNDLLIPVVQQRGGRVVKTIGDAIMATFPSANLAADAAIGMMQAVHDANARVSHEEERFEIRIGINYGTALVNDKDGDVYGDMVNVAARVQSEASRNQILVSDVVREYLSPTLPVKPAGTFQLKGKSQEFQLYEVHWKQVARPEVLLEKPNLGGRYVVLDLLGSGGMASVWRARDEKLGRDVAVKVLHGHMQLAFATRERFQREAVVAASLVHDNIVQVYDYATHEAPQSFIAMELVEGQQLRGFMERRGALGAVATLLIGHEIARGLAHAHARTVIHRDLKPENVLVSNTGAVKIADFGIAGVGEMVRLTHAGAQLGTPAYLSPEQVKGGSATPRSDVFALGVMLYEMACGRSPFPGETPAAIMFRIADAAYAPAEQQPGIDRDLAVIIRRCLAKEARDRYASAGELAQALAEALHARDVGDPRSSLARFLVDGRLPKASARITGDRLPVVRPRRKLPVLAVVGAAAVLVAVGIGALLAGSDPAKLPVAAAPPTATAQEPARAERAARSGSGSQQPVEAPSDAPADGPAAAAARSPPEGGTVTAGAQRTPAPEVAVPAVATTTSERIRPASSKPRPPAVRARSSEASEARAPSLGTLRLTVSGGWADIKVDGSKLGRYPTQRTFTLTEGNHLIELTGNAARKPYRATISIKPAATLDHAVELQPVE